MTGCDITQRGSEGWGPWCDTARLCVCPSLPPSLRRRPGLSCRGRRGAQLCSRHVAELECGPRPRVSAVPVV